MESQALSRLAAISNVSRVVAGLQPSHACWNLEVSLVALPYTSQKSL